MKERAMMLLMELETLMESSISDGLVVGFNETTRKQLVFRVEDVSPGNEPYVEESIDVIKLLSDIAEV